MFKPLVSVDDEEIAYDGYQDQGCLEAPISRTPARQTTPQVKDSSKDAQEE